MPEQERRSLLDLADLPRLARGRRLKKSADSARGGVRAPLDRAFGRLGTLAGEGSLGYHQVMANRFLAAALAASLTILAAPLAALAQDEPSYAGGQPSYATQDEQIHGRIVSFDGAYALQVRDDRGFIDNVQLHQGTIINPTGLTLTSGMVVAIHGYNSGSFFAATEVDTPYTMYGAVPYYSGHPWYYWGPSISLGFFFGSGGWWHGGYYGRGYYARPFGYGRPYAYGHPYSGPARAYGAYRTPTGGARSSGAPARGTYSRSSGARTSTSHASSSHGGGHH